VEIIFKKCQEISYHKNILTLLENAFEDKVFALNTQNAFFNGYCSEYPNFVLIEHRRIPVAVAIVALRKIHFFGTIAKAMTVGPFAVAQNMQNQGLGRKLMEGIEDLAKKLSVDLLYLVGIKGFYKSLGFKTFMQRSKIVLNPEEINEGSSASIQAFDGSYRDDSVESYQNLSSLCNFSSKRTDCDWDWLLGHATNSYYFYKPIVVLDENANFVGYFTHDPNDPGRLREVVYQLEDNKIETFLCGLRQYASALKIDRLEIMTPPCSPLHTYCKRNFNFSFVELHNVDAGQMVKGLTKETIKKIQNASCSLPAFIFQGDNF
jgi:predicted N-acetyltransferase YhbS